MPGSLAPSGTVSTNIDGEALLNTTETTDQNERLTVPLSIRVTATVRDLSEVGISARARVLAHPSTVYVGARAANGFGRVDEPYSVDLVTVTPLREIVPDQTIEVEVVEVRWERASDTFGSSRWVQNIYPLTSGNAVTGADGTTSFSFTPTRAGIYRLRALTYDKAGRGSSSTVSVYVSGRQAAVYSQPGIGPRVDILVDPQRRQPGDTAEVIISNSFDMSEGGEVYALIATERANITRTEVIRVTEPSLTYTLELTEDDAPGITVTVWMTQGSGSPGRNAQIRSGSVRIPVAPVHKTLNVEVQTEGTAGPGEPVTVNVRVTDHEGQPVQAEVAVKITDEAVLSLLPPNSIDLLQTFYGRVWNSVVTTSSLSSLLDALTDAVLPGGMGGGGGGGGSDTPDFDVRDNFVVTPLWEAHLVTDADGRASASLTMPDNLTRWQIEARAVTADTAVGEYRGNITSSLPLIIRPAVPRFFVVGDVVELAAVINNTTGDDQMVTASIEAAGVEMSGPAEQQISIAAGRSARVTWPVTVQNTEAVDLTFFASTETGFTDAAKPALATGPDNTIPVYRYTAPDIVGTGGVLMSAGSVSEAISLPTRFAGQVEGSVNITLDPSLAAASLDSLKYLEYFPHICIEQTVSRFWPNVAMYRALSSFDLVDARGEAHAQRLTADAVTVLLNAQNTDGGFGWFRGMETNDLVTAYALIGLVEARDAGLLVDLEPLGLGGGGPGSGGGGEGGGDDNVTETRETPNFPTRTSSPLTMMNRAYIYLQSRVEPLQTGTLNDMMNNRQALIRYALAAYSDDSLSALELGSENTLLTPTAAAYMLLAYHRVAPDAPQVTRLVDLLTNSATLSATGTYWEDASIDRWNWDSDTRTTAVALAALTRVQPDHPLLPGAVRWLMTARQGTRWSNTQETAWATIAFTDWMRATGELEGEYRYAARFNDTSLAEGQITPEKIREQYALRVDVQDLLSDQVNLLSLTRGEGAGALYYTTYLDLDLPADEIDAISRGATVTREYLNADGEPVSEVNAGDVITVRLTLNLTRQSYYFVLDDPLPAGLESIDPNLSINVGSTGPRLSRSDARWFWGYWSFNHTELRDERTSLYADYLRPGTYVYTYQAQAVTPGQFQVMPAQAYEFYSPEVFGRTDGQIFTILPRGEAVTDSDAG